MKNSLFPTLKNYKKEYLGKDIAAGIMIAAVSIPISMGYAEVSGLPAVFGLYGSVLPILFFALFSTSPQFIFGVDAAPAAIAGAALASLGIESGSADALRYIPVIALFVGLWLLLFCLLFSLCRLCCVGILHFVMRVSRMCPDYVKLSVQNASIQVRIF